MIPEIDKLDKYKNYLHAGILILLLITVISIVYSVYFEVFSWQTFLFRMIGIADIFVMYVVAVKAVDVARHYLLKK
jgi:uncharacterized integral membrane protein